MVSWHEILPSLGDFINKTGFPIALWIIAGMIFYKAFKKFFTKLEPIIDAHFELVTELKNTSGRTADILEAQNNILTTKFDEHSGILREHGIKLEKITNLSIDRNEMLEDNKKIIPIISAGVANGIKR